MTVEEAAAEDVADVAAVVKEAIEEREKS